MRYLPHTQNTRADMLKTIGAKSVNDFYKNVPEGLLLKELPNLPLQQFEMQVEQDLSALASQNLSASNSAFFLGAGCYNHHVPASVDHLIQRGEFLTAYTPYQPEVSQGTLAATFEFQSYIAAITGQEIANASMYDGATATAEAALMAMRITKKNKIAIANGLHPHYKEVLNTYVHELRGEIISEDAVDSETACIILQTPNFYGEIPEISKYKNICEESKALLVSVVTEIVSLGMLPPLSEADIVCGEAQSIGNAMSYGGPHLGFFACSKKNVRQMPGRLVGKTTDAEGKEGYVLTLNAREQHIRRDKATSNICTNEGLCSLAFAIHMSLLGENGFKQLARINHEKACQLSDKFAAAGYKVHNRSFFNEFVVELKHNATEIVELLAQHNVIAGYPLRDNKLLVAVTEKTTEADMDILIAALEGVE